ncbi:hypothetical protein CRM94_36350 [Burkholderia gladioli]|uniref:Uncharacterized protein n=1 Tax=Burkholderia gladioli TaxID=28095 RepID=A0A2A7S8C5_BURGA|nr:hypothetical protein CEJ98_18970 [Burkholderia gladioli pv. gladioli]AWY53917.1 hypothetical protein A8H28_22160 [Burkholderia gladioli pv. gladioli]PEH39722.1 hypothetical protein CRM94_36350 [Burkholderia gladioli]
MADIGLSNSCANVDLDNSVRSTDRPAHIHQFHAEVRRRVTVKQRIPLTLRCGSVEFVEAHGLLGRDSGTCMHCQRNVCNPEVRHGRFGVSPQLRSHIAI